jgi:hypothetical protein
MESYVTIGEGFEKSYVCLHGGRGVKNCQNHAYIIAYWRALLNAALKLRVPLGVELVRYHHLKECLLFIM